MTPLSDWTSLHLSVTGPTSRHVAAEYGEHTRFLPDNFLGLLTYEVYEQSNKST